MVELRLRRRGVRRAREGELVLGDRERPAGGARRGLPVSDEEGGAAGMSDMETSGEEEGNPRSARFSSNV